MYYKNEYFVIVLFQITQQLEGICLQVIGTVLQQHVLGKYNWFLYFHMSHTVHFYVAQKLSIHAWGPVDD